MAEADGNRTHRPHRMRATGFEDQGGHQATFASAGALTFADSGGVFKGGVTPSHKDAKKSQQVFMSSRCSSSLYPLCLCVRKFYGPRFGLAVPGSVITFGFGLDGPLSIDSVDTFLTITM